MGEHRGLTDDEIFARIDVLPPYYALRDVALDEHGDVTAQVSIEQPLGAEIGPISGAEAGRHLAIAGSVAAAFGNPAAGRHHYLATDAELRRAKKVPVDATELVVRAHGTILDERTAHAMVTAATADGRRVCSLSCYYAIVEYDTLRFFFGDHVQETPAVETNPFVELLEPQQVDIAGGHIELDLGTVDAASCAGHFDGLPAMPVAYLMSNVTAAAGRLLRKQSGDDQLRFSIREGSVRADGLAFAGEQVRLQGEHQGTRYGNEWVYLEAFSTDDKRVGAVHLKLAPHRRSADGD